MPTQTGFTVTWVNANIGTQPVNNNVQTRVNGQTLWNDELPTTTGATQVIAGKIPNTLYNVRVKAANVAGAAFSTIVNAQTLPSTPVPPPGGSGAIILDSRIQNPRQTLVDSSGVTWGISLMGKVMFNGVEDGTTNGADRVVYTGTSIFHRNGQGNASPAWFSKAIVASPAAGGWGTASSPLLAAQPYRIADILRTFGHDCLPHWSNSPNSTVHMTAINYLSNGTHAFRLFRAQVSASPTIAAMCSAGSRGCFIVPDQGATSWDFAGSIAGQISRVGVSKIFAFENTNEPNGTSTNLSVGTVQSLEDAMGAAIASRSDCAGIVPNVSYSPHSDNEVNYVNGVGNLTNRGCNWGNAHTYTHGGNNEANQPWNNSNGPNFGISMGQIECPGRTMLFTEFGINYPGSTISYEKCTANAAGKILMNTLLDNYYVGGAGSFIFSLFDETGETFRLFDFSANPDLCATWLRNFVTILRDDGATALTFNPGVIDYTVGVVSNGRYLKTQGTDGKDRLILWNEPEVQNPTPNDISPTPVTVTVTCNQAISSIFRYDPTVSTASQQTIGAKTAGQTFTVSLTGYPQVIILTP